MEGCRLDSENLRSAWFEFEGDRLLARRADTGRNARERSLRGELDAPTLSWLDETLGASATRPTLVYTDAALVPKLRRACRRSWSTSARAAGRGRTCSSFGGAPRRQQLNRSGKY